MFWIIAIVQGPVFLGFALSFSFLTALRRSEYLGQMDGSQMMMSEDEELAYHLAWCAMIAFLMIWLVCFVLMLNNIPDLPTLM